MNKNIYRAALAAAALAMLAGCSVNRGKDKSMTVTPSPCVIIPDSTGKAEIDLTFHVPPHCFSKRSRLIILPQLLSDDTVVAEYSPVVLDAPIYAKKKKRIEVLEGYRDPYSGKAVAVGNLSQPFDVQYHDIVRLPESVRDARIIGVVTTDGCGVCTGRDTIDMARVAMPTIPEPVETDTLDIFWIEPQFRIIPKERSGKGLALLQFIINRYDINLTLGNNSDELEDMVSTLAPILQDSLATLSSLEIYGMASADGSLAFNTALSRNRAESAKQWLVERLEIPADVQRIIKVGSRPEGWQPVLDAMISAGDPDSTAVKAILERYADSNDDVQERHIRRLPAWGKIKSRYLQKDRKVEYKYTYTIRNFTTDAELLEMYRTRPDAFNEEELLRVATLVEGIDRKKEVYLCILEYYPLSEIAANNLAVLYQREGKTEEARRVLEESALRVSESGRSGKSREEKEKAADNAEGIATPGSDYGNPQL